MTFGISCSTNSFKVFIKLLFPAKYLFVWIYREQMKTQKNDQASKNRKNKTKENNLEVTIFNHWIFLIFNLTWSRKELTKTDMTYCNSHLSQEYYPLEFQFIGQKVTIHCGIIHNVICIIWLYRKHFRKTKHCQSSVKKGKFKSQDVNQQIERKTFICNAHWNYIIHLEELWRDCIWLLNNWNFWNCREISI